MLWTSWATRVCGGKYLSEFGAQGHRQAVAGALAVHDALRVVPPLYKSLIHVQRAHADSFSKRLHASLGVCFVCGARAYVSVQTITFKAEHAIAQHTFGAYQVHSHAQSVHITSRVTSALRSSPYYDQVLTTIKSLLRSSPYYDQDLTTIKSLLRSSPYTTRSSPSLRSSPYYDQVLTTIKSLLRSSPYYDQVLTTIKSLLRSSPYYDDA